MCQFLRRLILIRDDTAWDSFNRRNPSETIFIFTEHRCESSSFWVPLALSQSEGVALHFFSFYVLIAKAVHSAWARGFHVIYLKADIKGRRNAKRSKKILSSVEGSRESFRSPSGSRSRSSGMSFVHLTLSAFELPERKQSTRCVFFVFLLDLVWRRSTR